ncbi:hypothetical protein C8Q77DRAFT_1280222 [Trametes polyzona]|nr:hypothetical protein C8Q77DRAFT_1280222 [Trametes polyzona]
MGLNIDHLKAKALEVITEVVEGGKLDEFTNGTFRKAVEQAMSLEAGTLNAPEYKPIVHAVAKDYIKHIEERQAEEDEAKKKPASKKGKSTDGMSKAAQPRKPRAKESDAAPSSGKAKGRKSEFRSASIIPSSDDEAGSGADAEPSSSKPKPRTKAASRGRAKRIESDPESSADEPPSKRTKQDPAENSGGEGHAVSISSPSSGRKEAAAPVGDDPKSESEMSVLIDEPPVRKRKKKGESAEPAKAKATKGRKRKEPSKELSKDEETIKRLKSLVVACGVRKVWSKEFKGLDKPSDQIRRLKQILSDLGMTGRMSMEQAKAIKAKREFEKELEDVQEFASKITSGPSTKGSRQKPAEEEEESEVEAVPKRKTARQSIMAFLGDESE